MDGLEVNGVALYLTHIPGRKSLVFCFIDEGRLCPVAYVSAKLEDMAVKEWKKMLGDSK